MALKATRSAYVMQRKARCRSKTVRKTALVTACLMSRRDCASGVPANARVTTTAAAPSSLGAMRATVSRPTSSCRCTFG